MIKKIRVVCSSCGNSGYVTDEAEKVTNVIDAFSDTKFPCQMCDGFYIRYIVDGLPCANPVSFSKTAEQFWRLVAGPPDEQPKSADVIEKMKGQIITDVVGQLEDGMVVIEKLVLGNGTIVWLGFRGRSQIVSRMKEGQNDGKCEGSEG